MKALKGIYLTPFFFFLLGGVILLYITAFVFPFVLYIAHIFLLAFWVFAIIDGFLVYFSKEPVRIERKVSSMLNLGDQNTVELHVYNTSEQTLTLGIIEGYPVQLQKRDERFSCTIAPQQVHVFTYQFKPSTRGEYVFTDCWVYISSTLHFLKRKEIVSVQQTVQVYPSILQMKQYELRVFHQQSQSRGLKKMRRIGHNNEFEQIKNYNQGDDLRTVNWKATSKKSELMVNQYQEERSQHIYAIIDKSRNMQLDFENMTMLDYAINASLVFANIILKKGDKAGLITFSDKTGTQLSAEKSAGQLRRILQALYNQKTKFNEANFDLLYESIRHTAKTRSLLMLYTNFESEFALRRALPTLKKINQRHVLVVVFFQNNGLEDRAFQQPTTTEEIYEAAIAEKLITVKLNMARELQQNGIQTILTRPEDLSLHTINKYLELKARGTV